MTNKTVGDTGDPNDPRWLLWHWLSDPEGRVGLTRKKVASGFRKRRDENGRQIPFNPESLENSWENMLTDVVANYETLVSKGENKGNANAFKRKWEILMALTSTGTQNEIFIAENQLLYTVKMTYINILINEYNRLQRQYPNFIEDEDGAISILELLPNQDVSGFADIEEEEFFDQIKEVVSKKYKGPNIDLCTGFIDVIEDGLFLRRDIAAALGITVEQVANLIRTLRGLLSDEFFNDDEHSEDDKVDETDDNPEKEKDTDEDKGDES